jgi:hypothetical protein
MKNPERQERGKKAAATLSTKKNIVEKARAEAERQKALESLNKVKETLPEPEDEEQDGDVHASYTCLLLEGNCVFF